MNYAGKKPNFPTTYRVERAESGACMWIQPTDADACHTLPGLHSVPSPRYMGEDFSSQHSSNCEFTHVTCKYLLLRNQASVNKIKN
jgi:hypothetical protein